jgi:hypothetical protein
VDLKLPLGRHSLEKSNDVFLAQHPD